MYNMERYCTRPYCIEKPYWTRRLRRLVQYGFSIFTDSYTIFLYCTQQCIITYYFLISVIIILFCRPFWRTSWSLSYDSWIYNYLCNQCLSPLMLWVQISTRTRCTTLCDKVCQWLTTGRWFSSVLIRFLCSHKDSCAWPCLTWHCQSIKSMESASTTAVVI
jgi:hypothetical protein